MTSFALRATAVTRGWKGHRNSQHTKLTLEKKIPLPLLPAAPVWIRTRSLSVTSPALYQVIPLHIARKRNRKETQTTVVWTCLPFIRSGQIHLARHSQRGKKTRQIVTEEVRRQHQGMDRPGVRQVSEGEQRKIEEAGCEIICGTPTTLAV